MSHYKSLRLITHPMTALLLATVLGLSHWFPAATAWGADAAETGPDTTYAMAWSAPAGDGWEIFLSRLADDGWGPPLQISDNGKRNLVPAVVRSDGETHWVFWIRQAGADFEIHFARVGNDGTIEQDTVSTLLTNNMAPTALFDDQKTLWLAWSGYDGTDEDIYFSVWEDSRWSPAVRVNQDDYTPDVQPILGMDPDGSAWILWRGFTDGSYRFFSSRWNGESWDPEEMVEDGSPILQQIRAQLASHPALPEQVQDPMKGSLFEPGAAVQSLPLFFQNILRELGEGGE